MSERRGGPFDLFTVNDAKFYQRSLLVEDGLMGACAKTRGVTPNTWMKTCAHFPGPAVPARLHNQARASLDIRGALPLPLSLTLPPTLSLTCTSEIESR